ncbi:hypothetical protein DLH72_04030 [Candidatus Gracilibacteria bacterium]|nr:MAG: hypothetical protein DLH72_04030 [Candidatus Gracilibacteria bacterium]
MKIINYKKLAKEMARGNIKATFFAFHNADRKKLKEALDSTYSSDEDDENCSFRFFDCVADGIFGELHSTDFFDELI